MGKEKIRCKECKNHNQIFLTKPEIDTLHTMIFSGIEWQISHFSDPDGEISFLRCFCECSWLPGDHEQTRSGIKWDPWWSSKCHVPTWPLNQTYWSASLLAVQTHIEARSTQRGRDWREDEGGEQVCSAALRWRQVWGKGCDVSQLLLVCT